MKRFSFFLILLVIFLTPYISSSNISKNFQETCVEGDCVNGQGTYIFFDGSKYDGEWKDDFPNGQGIMTWTDGSKYVGEFKDGLPNGKGTLTSADGKIHVGEFKNGAPHGQGTRTYLSGAKYAGEFKDGLANGKGKLISPDGEEQVGEFKDGVPVSSSEDSKVSNSDGSSYAGESKDDLSNSLTILIFLVVGMGLLGFIIYALIDGTEISSSSDQAPIINSYPPKQAKEENSRNLDAVIPEELSNK